MAQAVYLFVDVRFLFDVDIRLRDVCLRLVVVVVGDEVLHRVVGEVFLKLGCQLRCQRLVVRNHKRRALHLLDDLCHRVGFA